MCVSLSSEVGAGGGPMRCDSRFAEFDDDERLRSDSDRARSSGRPWLARRPDAMRFDDDEKCLRSRCWLELLCMLAPLRAVCESSAGVGCDAAGSLDSAGQWQPQTHDWSVQDAGARYRAVHLSVRQHSQTARRAAARAGEAAKVRSEPLQRAGGSEAKAVMGALDKMDGCLVVHNRGKPHSRTSTPPAGHTPSGSGSPSLFPR